MTLIFKAESDENVDLDSQTQRSEETSAPHFVVIHTQACISTKIYLYPTQHSSPAAKNDWHGEMIEGELLPRAE